MRRPRVVADCCSLWLVEKKVAPEPIDEDPRSRNQDNRGGISVRRSGELSPHMIWRAIEAI